VVIEIAEGRFGNKYKGSSLETVVGSIAEQRQIFEGADHAFLWKPKLRIPDIYESPENQRSFGRFLDGTEGDRGGGALAYLIAPSQSLDLHLHWKD
jgi:type II restriction enzyme